MKRINLSEMYYFFNHEDEEVLVEDDVYEVMEQYRRSVHAQNEKIRRYKAYYSLDRAPYLENYTVTKVNDPLEMLLVNELSDNMMDAIDQLTYKQARRVYMYYYCDMSVNEIARHEGVHRTSVEESLNRSIKKLRKILNEAL